MPKQTMPDLSTMPDIASLVPHFTAEWSKKRVGVFAAASAFCMLLSAIPALIVVSAVLPHTSLSEANMVEFFLLILPDTADSLVRMVFSETYRVSGGVLPVSILFMLWSAGFGMMQLTRGLNTINDVVDKRNYFLTRLLGTFYTILVMALMLAILFLQIFVKQLIGAWESAVPGGPVPHVLTSALRYVVLFVLAVALFLLLYTTLPATKRTVWGQLPGAIVSAVGWEFLSGFFALYVRFSHNLNAYYGSLTTVVVLMLWVYWCIYIMLFGAFLNRFIEVYVFPPEGAAEGSAAAAGAAAAGAGAATVVGGDNAFEKLVADGIAAAERGKPERGDKAGDGKAGKPAPRGRD